MDGMRLQWGHDKIVMEVKVHIGSTDKSAGLQWGHDKIVMEVWNLDFVAMRGWSFNGAMTK